MPNFLDAPFQLTFSNFVLTFVYFTLLCTVIVVLLALIEPIPETIIMPM